MTTWPQKFSAEGAPREVLALAEQLVPRMIAGEHPALEALRQQRARARVASVELTGAGVFVNYRVPDDTPRADPPDFQGGDARITAEGLQQGAGCVLFVRGGRLAFFEVYTWGEVWCEATRVLSIEGVVGLDPPPEPSP